MMQLLVSLFLSMMMASTLYAAQSTITEVEGSSCLGEDKTKKQTMDAALTDAKRMAVEYAATYIKSETKMKNFQLEKDLIEAYGRASVKVIEEMDKKWYKDESMGDCFRLKIKAEVIPDEKGMEKIAQNNESGDDPSAPLNVKAWTDKKGYTNGEKIRVYIKGNKPFYARVVYKDAGGSMVQLLPNPHRSSNYFNGGTIYEIPSGEDKFELEVTPPFGSEDVMVYASTSPLGDISLEAEGGVYQIKTKPVDVGGKTRGVKLKEKDGKENMPSEFFEDNVVVRTGK